MLFSENFRIAIRALRANKLRSGLTMLGIIIGVAAVVALLSIGNGATASITSSISNMGTNLLTISPGPENGEGGPDDVAVASYYLYFSDYERLEKQLKGLNGITPEYQARYDVTFGKTSRSVPVSGILENYIDVNAYQIATGQAITDAHNKSQERVAVLGSKTAKDLFGALNPIGQTIRINDISFTVIGVLKEKGSSGFFDPDNIVLIPIETGYARVFGSAAMYNSKPIVGQIVMSVANAEDINSVILQTEYFLRREHKLNLTEKADFNLSSQSDFLDTLSTVTQTLTIFLGSIAGISLLVGGIGIMNIMLVSVTERTKEIGLRKAVGAHKNQILVQFLIETLVVSTLGGLLGIVLGVGVSFLVQLSGLITPQIAVTHIALAFFFSLTIGLFFGIYPAYRAANLHPIQALRYE